MQELKKQLTRSIHISTSPKKSAAQKFRPAEPIRAAVTNRTTFVNFSRNHQKMMRLKAL